MRITATETTQGIVLTFSNSPPDGNQESIAMRHSEVKKLTIEEAIALLHNRLVDKLNVTREERPARSRGIVETEIVDTGRSTQVQELEIELDGDEDDEDLSLFEVVIDTPYQEGGEIF